MTVGTLAPNQLDLLSEGHEEHELADRLNGLNQLLYMRGGIKPASAAIDELAKLLLIRIGTEHYPSLQIEGYGSLGSLMAPSEVRTWSDTAPAKAAFKCLIEQSALRGSLPDGSTQPVWPIDEPLRISRVDILAEALEILGEIDLGSGALRGLDPLGTAFDTFLQGKFEHAGGLGTYLTPATVARTMAEICFDLFDGEPRLAGDPCCGTGRFLAAIVAERAKRFQAPESAQATEGLFGADQSPNSVAMARVNLLAYGATHPLVFADEDSITDASVDKLLGQVDLILANPPFGDSKYDSQIGIQQTARMIPTVNGRERIDPALAFVARCIQLLSPGGVAGIVLPDGVLDSAALRSALLPTHTEVQVAGVLSLPPATFAPGGTTAKTSVLFLRKSTSNGSRVFIAKAEHVGYLKQKSSVVADPAGNDLPQIRTEVAAILDHREASPLASKFTAWIETPALTSLDAATYDLRAIDARAELLDRGGKTFGGILSKAGRTRRNVRTGDIPFISVLHVDELGAVDWKAAESYNPKTPGKVAMSGSLLVSLLNPAKFRATVIPEQYDAVHCSAEFGIFESSVDPYAALVLLQHELVRAQIAPLGRGTSSSRRRIVEDDVLRLIAPPFDEEWLRQVGERARACYQTLDGSQRELREILG